MRRYCADCHVGSPEPGKSLLAVMDYQQLTAKGPPVPFVANGGRSQIIALIKDGSMPPANRRGPSIEEVKTLEAWFGANAPEYPKTFDDEYARKVASADTKAQGVAAVSDFRYISFANQLNNGTLTSLAEPEAKLRVALVAASGKQPLLVPVDPAATVFRLDLRSVGWHTSDLFEKVERGKPDGVASLIPFDLIQMESSARDKHPLHADWLTAVLYRDGKLRPLGEELRSLVELSDVLERNGAPPAGPPLHGFGVTLPHGVLLPKPSLSARGVGDITPNPAPFTLTAELVVGGHPVNTVKVSERFKLRVNADRQVYLLLLAVQADGEMRVQEFAGGTVLQANALRELAPNAGGFSISGILTGCDTATEYFLAVRVGTANPGADNRAQ